MRAREEGSYGYLVTPTINATGAKSDKKRTMLFTYDFAFPPKCAAK